MVIHLEEIEAQTASFDRVTDRLGREGFIAAWARSGTPEQIDDKGSIERAYEQIVNDLQGMLDVIEVAAFEAGAVPDPRPLLTQGVAAAARDGWWKAADALGLDTSAADRSQAPGRWRRLAFYEHLDHDLATLLVSWCDSRNLLQHGYAHRNAQRGAFVWESMRALRARLPEVIAALITFRDTITLTLG